MAVLPDARINGTWNDTTLTAAERAEALLAEMTLVEKIRQLGSAWPGPEGADEGVAPWHPFEQAETYDETIVDGVGHITRPFGTWPQEPIDAHQRLANLQRAAVQANRFGIPAIAHEECLTGFTAWRATVYPTSLAWAATWNPALISQMATAIGSDLVASGVHHGLAPVLDVVRDYRWGRVEETMGEDPYLVSEIAAGYVGGLQSAGLVATLKHFAGYSASRGARNHAPTSIGRRELLDVILPPFEKAVTKVGVKSVMNSYSDIDGLPPAADTWLLTELLRDSWGFEGTVVSDYWAIPFLQETHRVAEDFAEAAALALTAGIDIELPYTLGYSVDILSELVDSGRITEELIDRAARRVLVQKAELGLLDPDWAPADLDALDLDTDDNNALAAAVAAESIVLLENAAGALPLGAPADIAVIGPGAHDPSCLFGCYSFVNHVVPKHPGTEIGVAASTVLEAVRSEFPNAAVSYEQGCDILADDTTGIAAAADLARQADLTILVVGDRSGMFGHGTSGEGCDVSTLQLPGVQHDLCEAVLAASANVVLVVLSGRPYAIGDLADRALASVQVFFPGQQGAQAIAGVLSGRIEPSGRLPVQIPGTAASQPGTYLGPPLAQPSKGVSNQDPSAAFAFGHGLAYTTFAIDDVSVSTSEVATDGVIELSVQVSNTGDRAGTMVPQLYLNDPVATVARPVRQLVGFTRVELAAGEAATLRAEVPADMASYVDRDMRRVVEPGRLEITAAQSAADPGRTVDVALVGPTRDVDHTRAMSSTFGVDADATVGTAS